MQVDPIKPTLNAPGAKRLNVNAINCFQFCFNVAFKFNLRRYSPASPHSWRTLRALRARDAAPGRAAVTVSEVEAWRDQHLPGPNF